MLCFSNEFWISGTDSLTVKIWIPEKNLKQIDLISLNKSFQIGQLF